ncbi:USP-like protein isoform 2 [Balamuthia mandrillaris]
MESRVPTRKTISEYLLPLMGKKWVVCVDGSAESEAAFRSAVFDLVQPARHDHLFIVLVLNNETKDKANETLDLCKRIIESKPTLLKEGLSYELVLVEGEDKPGKLIVDSIKRHKAHYVVIGSRGNGFFHKKLMGSVSEYVAQHSPVPVMIVRPNNNAED